MENSTETGKTAMTALQLIEYTFFAAIFIFAVAGNTLVCIVIAQTPRMRTTRNFLLVNLAVSDLMVALFCIPFDVMLKVTFPVWPLGEAMCKVVWPAMTLFTNCSAATLAAISYDRYRAVIYPWKPRFNTVQTSIIISSTWLMSLLLVLPYILALKMVKGKCEEDWPVPVAVKLYTMGLFVFQYALPLLIIGFAYSMVALKLREQANLLARNRKASGISVSAYKNAKNAGSMEPAVESELPSNDPSFSAQMSITNSKINPTATKPSNTRQEEKRLRRTTKIVKMLVAVVLLYAICLLPNQVVWLSYEFGSGANWPHLSTFLTFGSLMVYVNSCVNPLLYAGMNDEFRKGFAKILKCRCKNGGSS